MFSSLVQYSADASLVCFLSLVKKYDIQVVQWKQVKHGNLSTVWIILVTVMEILNQPVQFI